MVSNLVQKLGEPVKASSPPDDTGAPAAASASVVDVGGVDAVSADGVVLSTDAKAASSEEAPTKILPTFNLEPGTLNSVPRAFPTPEAMASVDADFYRSEIKAGYRSPYFVELAESVASGRLDPESWLHSDLPTPELKKEMKKVKGVGDYAAENLLKLVGRYDGLALDSWLRSQFYKNHNKEKACPDKKIERHYKKYGPWRGLVIWCDMTERWIADME